MSSSSGSSCSHPLEPVPMTTPSPKPTCPTCGRMPSERFGEDFAKCEYPGDGETHGPMVEYVPTGYVTARCPDPIHDLADRLVAEHAIPPAEAIRLAGFSPPSDSPTAPIANAPDEELGWVIEKYIVGELNYWNGKRVDRAGWTTKNAEAVRFAREQDGWPILSWMLDGDGRITQHAWSTPSRAQEPQGDPQ